MWRPILLTMTMLVLCPAAAADSDAIDADPQATTTGELEAECRSPRVEQLLRTLIELEQAQLTVLRLRLQLDHRTSVEQRLERTQDALQAKRDRLQALESDLRELDQEIAEGGSGTEVETARLELLDALNVAFEEAETLREDVDDARERLDDAQATVLELEARLDAAMAPDSSR